MSTNEFELLDNGFKFSVTCDDKFPSTIAAYDTMGSLVSSVRFDRLAAERLATFLQEFAGKGKPKQPTVPAPGLHIGDTFLSVSHITYTIVGVYTDGVDLLYKLNSGLLYTSYDLIAQGYKRVTLVDDGGM